MPTPSLLLSALLAVGAPGTPGTSAPPWSPSLAPPLAALSDGRGDAEEGRDEVREELVSALVGPLYLGEEPPELRTLGAIWIPHVGAEGVGSSVSRTREEAHELAGRLVDELRGGASWAETASRYSAYRNRESGSVLGTFPPGRLTPELDGFLFSAEVGEVGGPVADERGVFVLRRMETRAGCRMIRVRGTGEAERERARELARRAREGEDFAELAREHSDHGATAESGGALSVFERGPNDKLVKLAAFRAEVGEVVGPLELLGAQYVLLRVPPEELPRGLWEDNWIRVRALLLAYDGADPGLRPDPRDPFEAMSLARELRSRIAAGEDMAALVAEHGDDPTDARRGGDLGWLHRRMPGLHSVLGRMFLADPGELSEAVSIDMGVAVLRRER